MSKEDYSGLSVVYDAVMKEAPYASWLTFLQSHLPHLAQLDVADIGCGTGRLTVELAALTRTIVGVDNSEEMLMQAEQRAQLEHARVLWLCQDMRELRIPAPVDVILSTCDCFNYLLTQSDMMNTLKRVRQSLRRGGWFGFDILGPKRANTLAEGLWYDVQDNHVVIYESSVSSTGRIDYDVLAFTSHDGNTYHRFEEHHVQQLYTAHEVLKMLQETGFSTERCLGDFGEHDISDADRIVFWTKVAD